MKKVFTTATALMFALGLTVAGQAAEKPKAAAPMQKVTGATQETAKPEAPKVAAAETKKVQEPATGMKQDVDKAKKEAEAAGKPVEKTGQDLKTPAGDVKKPGPQTPKTDKK